MANGKISLAAGKVRGLYRFDKLKRNSGWRRVFGRAADMGLRNAAAHSPTDIRTVPLSTDDAAARCRSSDRAASSNCSATGNKAAPASLSRSPSGNRLTWCQYPPRLGLPEPPRGHSIATVDINGSGQTGPTRWTPVKACVKSARSDRHIPEIEKVLLEQGRSGRRRPGGAYEHRKEAANTRCRRGVVGGGAMMDQETFV